MRRPCHYTDTRHAGDRPVRAVRREKGLWMRLKGGPRCQECPKVSPPGEGPADYDKSSRFTFKRRGIRTGFLGNRVIVTFWLRLRRWSGPHPQCLRRLCSSRRGIASGPSRTLLDLRAVPFSHNAALQHCAITKFFAGVWGRFLSRKSPQEMFLVNFESPRLPREMTDIRIRLPVSFRGNPPVSECVRTFASRR